MTRARVELLTTLALFRTRETVAVETLARRATCSRFMSIHSLYSVLNPARRRWLTKVQMQTKCWRQLVKGASTCCAIAILWAATIPAAYSQTGSVGEVSVTVTDPAGAAVPDATLQIGGIPLLTSSRKGPPSLTALSPSRTLLSAGIGCLSRRLALRPKYSRISRCRPAAQPA